VVLRREHSADQVEASWLAETLSQIDQSGFRVPRPLPVTGGGWLAPGGWSAWTFLEGRPATPADAVAIATAITTFHRGLAGISYPPHLRLRDSLYDRADRAAWEEGPAPIVSGPFTESIARLAALRRPLPRLRRQLIHGDLNPENVLIAPGLPPAVIDVAPYWRPPGLALAIAAYWLGPWRGEDVAPCFAQGRHFDQLLVRAGLRMLYSAALFGHVCEYDRYRMATAIICSRMASA
jgi:hypothetical protein